MKKILLISGLFILVFISILYELRPDFDFLGFSRSILMTKQKLPLIKMINSKNNFEQIIAIDQEGYVVTGPYWSLPPAKWQLEFEFIPYCQDLNLGYMDVVKKKGAVVYAKKDIRANKNGQKQIDVIEFDGDLGVDYEFRFFSSGKCEIKFIQGKLIRK